MHHINAQTKLYAVIGHPIAHSLSPAMHNRAFEMLGANAVYLAFDTPHIGDALAAAQTFGVHGLSLTIPHKVAALDHLERIDPLAQTIGAVNTAIREDHGWVGYNSDGWGAVQALAHNYPDFVPANILILGNGGAARAVAFALARTYTQSSITICAREQKNGDLLASRLRENAPGFYQATTFQELTAAQSQRYDLIINTTPVGMSSHAKHLSPLAKELLHPHQIIFDTVYSPKMTTLLQYAQEQQAQILLGREMLLFQGVFQSEMFTGQKAPIAEMRRILEDSLP